MSAPDRPRERPSHATVLLVDDDAGFLGGLAAALEARGYVTARASTLDTAIRHFGARAFDAALVDLDLGSESGLEVIPALGAHAGATSIIAMSGYASVASAVEAMRRGAFEFLEKPFPIERLVAVLERAVERVRLSRENAALRSFLANQAAQSPLVPHEFLGTAMREVHTLAMRAASLDVPVLVTGETGTGKEFVARAIHAASPRASGPWIAVNCGALQRDLVDSELFGHEKGAFTGARDLRLGLVEVARGGTLFLDELGELPLEAQAKLLRVIELGEFRRVGSSEVLRTDVRIVAATNRDLEAETLSGRFRQDLLFRLDVVQIRLPPLRDRRDEIPVFVEAFLRARGRRERGFPADVMEALRDHDWPGNLRELRNVVDRILVLGDPATIGVHQLPNPLGRRTSSSRPTPTPPSSSGSRDDLSLRSLESRHVRVVLELCQWNRREAAARLGIDPRTLYRKMREFGIEAPA